MARLRDVPFVLRTVGGVGFCRRVWKEIGEDNLFTLAAALAYSWLFAVFPFFIFILSFVVYLPAGVKGPITDTLRAALERGLPPQAFEVVWPNAIRILTTERKGLLGVGLLVAVWAASGGMNMTMNALDKCYDLPRGRPFYHIRLVAIILTVVVALLLMGVLILMPVGTVVAHWMSEHPSPAPVSRGVLWAWDAARYSLALLLMFAVVSLIYYYGASVLQDFRPVTPGAVFSIAVWILLALAFRLYVVKFGKYDRTYGTVGGVAILLLFFYIDALVLLIGAEINSEIDFARGVARGTLDFRARTFDADDDLSDSEESGHESHEEQE